MAYNKKTGFYEGFIYIITNVTNNKVYIGQTSTSIGERWSQHKCSSKRKPYTSPLYEDMNYYGIENFKIDLLRKYINKDINELHSVLNNKEIKYIAKYDSTNPMFGYNISKGGQEVSSAYKPVDVYDINGNFIESFESRKDASIKYNACIHTICHICNNGGNYRGLYVFRNQGISFDDLPIETCWNYKIYQFDLSGNCVGEYFSRNDAKKAIGVSINDALNHPNRLAGGYWWSTEKTFKYEGNKNCSSVDIYTVKGVFINSFKSCTEAAKFLNVSSSAVNSCARGVTCSIRRKWVARFIGDDFNKYPTRAIYPKCRKVNKYSLDNVYLETFNSLTLAAESVSSSKSANPNIHTRCNGKGDSAYGFRWFYADDPNQPDVSKIIPK